MEEKEKDKSKIKVIIVILSVLLAVSLVVLAGTLIYNYFAESEPTSVIVPDNIITPEENQAENSSNHESTGGNDNTASHANGTPQSVSSNTNITAKAISLHKRNPDDNTPFQVTNMFPGDAETKYYCVRVSHKGDVVLRFRADVRPGYDKLAEVLKCRITLPDSGEELYDGLMRDMPASLNCALKTQQSTTSTVYYEITAYLETSVDNEYMNKDLIADFRWWVEETDNLVPPQTGDNTNLMLWLCIVAISLFVLILLWKKNSKEEQKNEQ